MDVLIREVELRDTQAVTELSAELGYPVPVSTMEERIQCSMASPDRATLIACAGDALVGWIDVFVVHHLQTGASAEIGGLIVAAAYRGGGIGAQLLRRAEEWARARGLECVIVRSRSTREAAHRFYLREGYTQTKTSAVFARML